MIGGGCHGSQPFGLEMTMSNIQQVYKKYTPVARSRTDHYSSVQAAPCDGALPFVILPSPLPQLLASTLEPRLVHLKRAWMRPPGALKALVHLLHGSFLLKTFKLLSSTTHVHSALLYRPLSSR